MYIADGIYTANALNSVGLVKAACECHPYPSPQGASTQQLLLSTFDISRIVCYVLQWEVVNHIHNIFQYAKEIFFFEELCNM